MLSLRKRASQIIRNGKNSHSFVCFIDGKIRTFSTRIDDINSQVAELFGSLNLFSSTRGLAAPVALSMLLALTPNTAQALDANALPTGFDPVNGSFIVTKNSDTMNVVAFQNRSIVNYNSFNVGSNAQVNFFLPNSGSSILNRVTGGNMSQIYGGIWSNGRVFLVNPSGILFGSGANINVNGLVASTLSITNRNFLDGNYIFTRANGAPARGIQVDEDANIRVWDGGSAAFIASSFANHGNITANGGAIQVGIGDRVTLGSELIGITVNQALQNSLNKAAILNTGKLNAQQVKLIAATVKQGVMDVIVNDSGRISATKVVDGVNQGSIELVADNNNIVQRNNGVMDAGVISMTAKDGGIIQTSGRTEATTTHLTATGGSISQTGGKMIGDILNATATTAGQSVTLSDADYKTATLKANNGNIVYNDKDGVTVNVNAGSGNATITTSAQNMASDNGKVETDLILTGNNTAKTLTLNAKGGDIKQNGGSVSGDRLIATATSSGKNITLSKADFNKADLRTNFGDIQYQDTDGISTHFDVGGSANNTASITSNTGSDLNGNANSGIELRNNDAQTLGNQAHTVNLIAKAGNITQNGSTLNSHTANYTAENGDIQQNGGLLSAVNANLNATNGDIIISAGTVNATNVNLIANNGNIGQTGGAIMGNTLNATTTTAGKTISLTNADFNVAHLTSNNGNMTYKDRDGVKTSVNAGSGEASITTGASGTTANNSSAESGLELINANQAGKLNLTANGGNIIQAGGSTMAGNILNVATTNGNVTLDHDNANNFNHLSANTYHGDVSYRDIDSINVAAADLHAQGDLSLQTNGSGQITQSGSVKGVDTLSIITDQGNVTLDHSANDTNHLVALSNQGSVIYRDRNGINLALAQLGQAGDAFRGNLTVQSGGLGGITQSGLIGGVDTLKLRTDFGHVNLGLANDVQKLDTGSNYGGSTTFNNAHGFELTGANTVMQAAVWKGDLNLSAQDGVITQSNAASAAINASEVKITGNASLNNAGNNTSVFSAFGDGKTVSYTDQNGFNLGRSNLGNGTLNLTAHAGEINQNEYFPLLAFLLQNRNITENGGITAGSVNLTLGSGTNAYLTHANNAIGDFSLLGSSSCVKLVNSTHLNLTGATDLNGVLDVTVLGGNNLSQTGAINLNSLKVTMRDGGDFNLTHSENDVRVLSANASASTSQGDFVDGHGGFAVAASNMGQGDLSLTALNGGNINQGTLPCAGDGCAMPAGGIRADELKVTVIGGGDVNLISQTNWVNTFSANARRNARNSQIQFTNGQDLNVADSNLRRGDLALNVNGNMTQNSVSGDITHAGIIKADELNVTLLNGGYANLLNPNRVRALSANSTGEAVGRILFANNRNLNIANSQMGAGDLGLIVNGNLRQENAPRFENELLARSARSCRHDITQAGIIQADELAILMLNNHDATLMNQNQVNSLSANALGFFGPRSSQILFGNAKDLNVGFSFLGRGDLGLTLYKGANLDQGHLATSRDISHTGGIFGNELSVTMQGGGSADLTSQFNHVDVFSGNASCNSANSIVRFHNVGDLNIARSDVGQGKLYVSAFGDINNKNLDSGDMLPMPNENEEGPIRELRIAAFNGSNRDITANDSTIHGNVVDLKSYGSGSIDVYNDISATGPNSAVHLTTANGFGSINIHSRTNVEARTGGVYLNTNRLVIDGLVQGKLVQLWPWNLTLSMGVAGGSGGMQVSQNLVNRINTDSTLGLNTLMFGHRDYRGPITLGSLNMSSHRLTDVAFNAPRVFDATPNNDSRPNLIMAANRNVYLTSGAETVANWASAPGGISYGNNNSRFADLDIQVSGRGLIHVKLGDYVGIGNAFSLLTGGGNRAFINTLDDENSGSLKNYGSALSSRIGSLIFNQIKGTTVELPGNPIDNQPTSFGSVRPVQFIPNQFL